MGGPGSILSARNVDGLNESFCTDRILGQQIRCQVSHLFFVDKRATFIKGVRFLRLNVALELILGQGLKSWSVIK